jgi:hypothetical protein
MPRAVLFAADWILVAAQIGIAFYIFSGRAVSKDFLGPAMYCLLGFLVSAVTTVLLMATKKRVLIHEKFSWISATVSGAWLLLFLLAGIAV